MSTDTEYRQLIHLVKQSLDEQASQLYEKNQLRLTQARNIALAHKKQACAKQPIFSMVLAQRINTASSQKLTSLFQKALILFPIVILIISLIAISQWANSQRKHELANIDTAMINDHLPLNAYLDNGFSAYLQDHHL